MAVAQSPADGGIADDNEHDGAYSGLSLLHFMESLTVGPPSQASTPSAGPIAAAAVAAGRTACRPESARLGTLSRSGSASVETWTTKPSGVETECPAEGAQDGEARASSKAALPAAGDTAATPTAWSARSQRQPAELSLKPSYPNLSDVELRPGTALVELSQQICSVAKVAAEQQRIPRDRGVTGRHGAAPVHSI